MTPWAVFGIFAGTGAAVYTLIAVSGRVYTPRRIYRELKRTNPITAPIRGVHPQALLVAVAPGVVVERHYTRLQLIGEGGQTRYITAMQLRPLDELYGERAKRDLEKGRLAPDNPMTLDARSQGSLTYTGADYKTDPIKDQAEEEAVLARKRQRLEDEVRLLRRLNGAGVVYPRWLGYDRKRLVVYLADVGAQRLDRVLAASDSSFEIVQKVMADLAEWHDQTRPWNDSFLPGLTHTPELLLARLKDAAEALGLNQEESVCLLQQAEPLLDLLARGEKAGKIGDAAPRSFFWDGAAAWVPEFGVARWDLTALDVAEFLADPGLPLTLAQEQTAIASYTSARAVLAMRRPGEPVDELALARTIAAALMFQRVVLAGSIRQYLAALPRMTAEQRSEFSANVGWTVASFSDTLTRALDGARDLPEAASLAGLLGRALDGLGREEDAAGLH
jgi:aminoglycoside/choline kinase family phosphotransferase